MSATAPAGCNKGGCAPRYPLKPDPYSSHSIVARAVRSLIRSGAARRPLVLDVGCGAGPLGELLAGEPVSLVGLDCDPAVLEQAVLHGYAALVQADVEAGELPDGIGPADVLVCADVLEHLRWPDAALRRLVRRYLRAGGAVIVSLPNVAHWYVRAQLLAGRWPYADRGILDRTHLRFFTGASGAALVSQAGVQIERRWVTPLPLPALYAACRPGRSLYGLYVLSAWLTRCWPALLAYQFVYAGTYPGPPDGPLPRAAW
jgi:SAM-dependent methyltransferase